MKQKLHVRLASPRGFCAGVERAIRTVEEALAAHGAPVYVRHEIVHNAHVVSRLKAMGAVDVNVETGDMIPANKLYNSIGFTEMYKGFYWRKATTD